MLRRDVAEVRLAEIKIKDWEDKRSSEMKKLPAKLRTIGRGILDRTPEGKKITQWQKVRDNRDTAYKGLTTLSSKDRRRIFGAIVPKLAEALDLTWELTGRQPYCTGYERKGFRAPSKPELTNHARQSRFAGLFAVLGPYNQDAAWVAAWAAHISGYSTADDIGVMLAAVLDKGGDEADEVFGILADCARSEHEIGAMGRHVSRAMLCSSRPDGWELMEKMLLAAQRQEGLRQVILETLDEAHPEAFRRMVRIILDQNLIRFSSVVRAFDVWLGVQWDSLTPAKVRHGLASLLENLEDPKKRDSALKDGDGEDLYYALWTLGFEDAPKSVARVKPMLKDKVVTRRYLAAHYLQQLQLPEANKSLTPLIDDEDSRIAVLAFYATRSLPDLQGKLFEPILKLSERLPKHKTYEALVWPWTERTIYREHIAVNLFDHLGKRPLTDILPHMELMGASGRSQLLSHVSRLKKWPDGIREVLFDTVGDRSAWIQERALDLLKKCKITESEAEQIEGYLTRKSAGLRRGVLGLLKKQPAAAALASADRLLDSSKIDQRLGGLELLRELVAGKKSVAAARERAEAYRDARKKLKPAEEQHIEAILTEQAAPPTLDDALGLMDPKKLTPARKPTARKVSLFTPAALALLQGLDAVVAKHSEEVVEFENYQGKQELLLANVHWQLPSPNRDLPLEKDLERLPLREVWQEWWENRPKKTRDKDGLELPRAMFGIERDHRLAETVKEVGKRMPNLKRALSFLTDGLDFPKLKYPGVVKSILGWFERTEPTLFPLDMLLDAEETCLALLPKPEAIDPEKFQNLHWNYSWLLGHVFGHWRSALASAWGSPRRNWSDEQKVRYWHLCKYRQPYGQFLEKSPPPFDLLVDVFVAGQVTIDDLASHLLGQRDSTSWQARQFSSLSETTARRQPKYLDKSDEADALVERCRQRVLEIELKRGDMPTEATEPAQALGSVFGSELAVRLLVLLGKKGINRQRYGQSRAAALSRLLAKCHPTPEDTAEVFAGHFDEALQQQLFPKERVLEFAFAAPQWIGHVEEYLGWDGFGEGIYWYFAHMPWSRPMVVDEEPTQKGERVDPWERYIQERCVVSREDRNDGVVDVDWFQRTFELVGPRHWNELSEASKFGTADNGYKKAQVVSDVLRGKAKRKDLIDGIRRRQLKENIRMLGLLPLAKGDRREKDLQQRFKVLMEYRRYVRTLSAMSKEGAQRALEIGMKNLALTAGYPDPVRLEWTMEGREIEDLAKGPVVVSAKGVSMSLDLDAQSQPVVTIQRGDKVLKSLPKEVRKNPRFKALSERRAELKRQASRMRYSLEAMMLRGDTFTGEELQDLFGHPVLVPMLSRLVLIGEGIAGYPVSKGKGLENFDGKVEPIKKTEQLRLAHCYDLLQTKQWSDWQAHLFRIERVQPFKQVFRELYVVTKQEKKDGKASKRYAGHQVQERQAFALLGSRGWSTQDGVSKTFFDAGLTVELSFDYGVTTPLEVEGLTLDEVQFRPRGEWKPIPLKDVPPVIFSETMRDLDLVVSVAHAGGVDPEASASTVEMREALLRETCSLLGVDNYKIKGSLALVDGELAKYTVHLGSGVVHKRPGGSLCIVPVHAQHRGRLFLPFADDDPRTAEVLSKVLLLARDSQIQDPTILEQLL